MKSLEKFSTVFLGAGVVSFLVALGTLGIAPALLTGGIPEDGGLPDEIPSEFKVHYATVDEYQKALLQGRDIYIKEACWHCHSQYIRPVSKESAAYGLVSTPAEYENLLHRPQLFGTRRVGPDLIREAGKRTNDWHYAHLYNPKSVEPLSVMPKYTWYFDETQDPPVPKPEAVALVAYLQALGHWAQDARNNVMDPDGISMPPAP